MDELASNLNSLELHSIEPSDEKAAITLSQKKSPQLYHLGYYFKRSYACKETTKVSWRCIVNSCKAAGYTFTETVGIKCDYYIINGKHLEQPDVTKFELLERRRLIKERAANSDDKARKILSLVEKPHNDHVVVHLPSYSADRQVIQREQKKTRPDYPKEPETLSDISLPDWLHTTLKDEQFMLYDSGVEDAERFFIFATLSNIALVENNDVFCDGTFSVAPKPFLQVYTFHVMLEKHSFPVIYVFLPRKTQSIYTRMLKKLSEYLTVHPKSITSDFEKAFLNAVDGIFPQTKIYGCYFHFKQSMWRKIQELGLSTDYVKNVKIYKALVMPQCLAYLPVDDVVEAFKETRLFVESTVTDERISKFYDYLNEYYLEKIKITRARFNKRVETKIDPMFPIGLWNINSRLLDDLPRTNNFCESWHNSFSGILNNHPLIYQLVDSLRNEQNKMENNILKLRTGKLQSKCVKSEINSVMKILSSYDRNKKLETIKDLSLL